MKQLDMDFIRARRDDGIARVAASSGDDWQDAALASLHQYALTHERFLTEEARADADQLPDWVDGRAWGQVVRRAVRLGWIERAGFAPARSSNLSPKPLWRSLICEITQ